MSVKSSSFPSDLQVLIARFREAKRRCGNRPKPQDKLHYVGVTFDFASPREAAEYMAARFGPIPPGHSIDRINPFQGYRPGNLRYLNAAAQRANQRCNFDD